ncbi:helix-turn-helix transcriptional regulator [Rhizobium sp. LjRoot30]|uniref:DNA-binding protein n=1 Tax=Rhizobium sp. LjRoot30 TaxID=3342320 RepID=UPI003ECEAF7E
MTTPAQIRAARAMLGLTIGEVAAITGLSEASVEDAERPSGNDDTTVLRIVTDALEGRGVLFLSAGDEEGGGPGIRLKRPPQADDATRPEHLNAANDD